jgi:hypothetical protein
MQLHGELTKRSLLTKVDIAIAMLQYPIWIMPMEPFPFSASLAVK